MEKKKKDIDIHEQLKPLVIHVRKTKGEKEALLFFIDYIQPIKKYFKITNKVKL